MSHAAPSADGLSSGTTKGREVDRHQAIVVGAGSSGLAAAVALQRRGFETIVIEKSDTIGASWRSRYAELRLNSWRPMSKLQGRGMPRQCGRYPSRDDVVAYLEQFAHQHGVALRLRTQLIEVQREHDLWRLETSSGRMLCRYLIIATGGMRCHACPGGRARQHLRASGPLIRARERRRVRGQARSGRGCR